MLKIGFFDEIDNTMIVDAFKQLFNKTDREFSFSRISHKSAYSNRICLTGTNYSARLMSCCSLQDYQLFFEAVECETLFKFLHIDAPKDEVEYIINNAPKEEVSPSAL